MELKSQRVKRLRLERGWTQQELADAAGLSLRTIQRVEKFANASTETVKCLCAVFEIDKQTLREVPVPVQAEMTEVDLRGRMLLIGLSMFTGSLLGAAITYLITS